MNLALRVGRTFADGYHELHTIFQAIELFDDVHARPAAPGEYRLAFQGEGSAFLPTDDTNLAMRAAKLLAQHFAVADAGAELLIRKRIPVAGGMAGGSADAAATLVACNELWQLGASRDDLVPLAAQLGADVPFLLFGGTALGSRRGDVIEPLEVTGNYVWVLALSHHGLSTPAVFQEFDRLALPTHTTIGDDLPQALQAGDVAGVGRALVNDLAAPAVSLQPRLKHILRIGREAGALGSIVSGSGPTCAFLAADGKQANRIAERLAIFSSVRTVRIAQGPARGAEVIA